MIEFFYSSNFIIYSSHNYLINNNLKPGKFYSNFTIPLEIYFTIVVQFFFYSNRINFSFDIVTSNERDPSFSKTNRELILNRQFDIDILYTFISLHVFSNI